MAKKKKKLKKKGIVVILLTLYLIIMAFYYVYKMPVKSIFIEGNILVTDIDIISAASINADSKLFFLNPSKVKENVKTIPLIKDVTLKRWFDGSVTIKVVENKVLFYNVLNQAYVLSDKQEVDDILNVLGIPVLINYVPNEVYEGLITKMAMIDSHIISYISEIEYAPLQIKDKSKDEYITVDSERFLFRMNDGNYVYINLPNFEKIELYEQYYAKIGEDKKGIFELDSKSNNVIHKLFDEVVTDGGGSNELSQ